MILKRKFLFIWLNNTWKNKRGRFFVLFLLPSFAGVTVFVLIPFLDVVKRSFLTAVTGEWTGLNNYNLLVHNQAFRLAIHNTLRFTRVGIPLLVLSGLVIAVLISSLLTNRSGAGQNARMIEYGKGFKYLYLFPMAVPTAVVVLVWKMVFSGHGFLNLGLTKLGGYSGLWEAVTTDYMATGASFYVLVASYLWKNTGYTVVLWLAGIMAVPKELTDAAAVDGANAWKRLWYIILPQLKGTLYTIVILSFLNSFKIFREAYLVAGSYPQQDIYLLQHLFNNWFVNLDFDKMAAAAVCVGGFIFIFTMLLQSLWDR